MSRRNCVYPRPAAPPLSLALFPRGRARALWAFPSKSLQFKKRKEKARKGRDGRPEEWPFQRRHFAPVEGAATSRSHRTPRVRCRSKSPRSACVTAAKKNHAGANSRLPTDFRSVDVSEIGFRYESRRRYPIVPYAYDNYWKNARFAIRVAFSFLSTCFFVNTRTPFVTTRIRRTPGCEKHGIRS